MSKRTCLNFLLSAFTQEPLSLSGLTNFGQVAQEFRVKPSLEILGKGYIELEKKAIALESHNLPDAFRAWMESIQVKLSSYKSLSDKVKKT
jgi:hypothetical protein